MVGILPGSDRTVGESVTSVLRGEFGSTQEFSSSVTLDKISTGDEVGTSSIEGNLSNDIQQWACQS